MGSGNCGSRRRLFENPLGDLPGLPPKLPWPHRSQFDLLRKRRTLFQHGFGFRRHLTGFLVDMWMPILASATAVWVVSSILPSGPPTMGKQLLQWFLYSVLISIFAADFAGFVNPQSATVAFRRTGTVAMLGYAVTYIPNSIWKSLAWTTTAEFILDGVIYGLVTGAVFAWLGSLIRTVPRVLLFALGTK